MAHHMPNKHFVPLEIDDHNYSELVPAYIEDDFLAILDLGPMYLAIVFSYCCLLLYFL